MSKREQGRVLAVQALYQWDLRGEEFDAGAADFLAESTRDSEVYFFARELAFGAHEFASEADGWIMRAAAHWEMKRMAAVDRNILRLAIYEMLGRDDIPVRVAIDQAIELAKRFGAAESGAFVNGILDRVLHESCLPGAGDSGGADPGAAPAAPTGASGGDPAADVPAARPSRQAGAKRFPDIKDWDEE